MADSLALGSYLRHCANFIQFSRLQGDVELLYRKQGIQDQRTRITQQFRTLLPPGTAMGSDQLPVPYVRWIKDKKRNE